MKWFEYQMEVDQLKAPDELKARLLAMQPKPDRPATPEPSRTSSETKGKAVWFPHWRRWTAGIAACAVVAVVGVQTLQSGWLVGGAGAAASSAALYSVPGAANYSLDTAQSNSLEASGRSITESQQSVAGDKIIYTAYLSLETKDYDGSRAALEEALTAAGGWMESSSESNGSDSARTLSLTLRVPEENYQSFLTAAGETASLVSRSEQADDVTSQYTDVEGRIANLEGQRDRLRELQASAETLSDLLDIEAQLSDVQYQLESWESQKNWYDDQIASCTVTVTLREVESYTPTGDSFLKRLGAAFGEGWRNFIRGLAFIAVTLAGWWPVVVILAAGAVVLVIFRTRRRN